MSPTHLFTHHSSHILRGRSGDPAAARRDTLRTGKRTMKLLTIDAFTDQPFRGNPAAVCLLDRERDAEWMQHVAAEMNLSETAFLLRQAARPEPSQSEGERGWSLRWFTPAVEVDLCGHATLASAHALWG